jgi:hypothetical protein
LLELAEAGEFEFAIARTSTVPRPELPGASNKVHARRFCLIPPCGKERPRCEIHTDHLFFSMTSTLSAIRRAIGSIRLAPTPPQLRPFPNSPAPAPTWEDLLGRR